MNKQEAIEVVEQVLEALRRESYDNLVARIGQVSPSTWHRGESGARYQVELVYVWDDQPGRNVRVIGCVDDGRWRALMPVNRAFIKAPDGSFVGE